MFQHYAIALFLVGGTLGCAPASAQTAASQTPADEVSDESDPGADDSPAEVATPLAVVHVVGGFAGSNERWMLLETGTVRLVLPDRDGQTYPDAIPTETLVDLRTRIDAIAWQAYEPALELSAMHPDQLTISVEFYGADGSVLGVARADAAGSDEITQLAAEIASVARAPAIE